MTQSIHTAINSIKEYMDDNDIDRLTVGDHMTLVKIGHDKFMAMFANSQVQRLGSEIRCELDGITYSADTSAGTIEEVKE